MADFFESHVTIRQHVLIRFGKWREIVAIGTPQPPNSGGRAVPTDRKAAN